MIWNDALVCFPCQIASKFKIKMETLLIVLINNFKDEVSEGSHFLIFIFLIMLILNYLFCFESFRILDIYV